MKITPHRQFLEGLATATLALLGEGRTAPTAPEIAAQRYQDPVGVPKVLLEEVRRRLPEVRSLLREQGHVVVPVSERYYRLRRRAQLSPRDVSACLSIGSGKNQAGILFVTDDDLLAKRINVAHEKWVYGSAAGKATAARARVGTALEEGLITQGEALAIGIEPDLFTSDDDTQGAN